MHVGKGEPLTYKASLSPGQYRIAKKPSLANPHTSNVKFKVPPGGDTDKITVRVPHTKRERATGRLRVVREKTGQPFKGLDTELKKGPSDFTFITGDTKSATDSTTDAQGWIEFWFWNDLDSKLQFRVAGYAVKNWDQVRTFSADELQQGVTWRVKTRDVDARIKVLVKQSEAENVPLTESLVKKAGLDFPESRFWKLPIYDRPAKRLHVHHATDRGRFSAEDNEFVYRVLEDGQPYIIGKNVVIGSARVALIEGAKTTFELEPGETYEGKVVIELKRNGRDDNEKKMAKLKGQVIDSSGQPVAGATIHAGGGPEGYQTVKPDKNGRFTVKWTSGQYKLTVRSEAHKRWNGRVNLKPEKTKEIQIELQTERTLLVRPTFSNDLEPRAGQVQLHLKEGERTFRRKGVRKDKPVRFYGVPEGKGFLVYTSGNLNADRKFCIGTAKTVIKGKKTETQVPVRKAQALRPQVKRIKADVEQMAILFFKKWQGRRALVGYGRWSKADQKGNKAYVPGAGKYHVRVFVPKRKGVDLEEYEDGWVYRAETVEVKERDNRVEIVVQAESKKRAHINDLLY